MLSDTRLTNSEWTNEDIWKCILSKMETMLPKMKGKSPQISSSGIYDDMREDWWTSGFWPGILWILYDITGKKEFMDEAWEWDGRIEKWFIKESEYIHHDVGFQFLPTAVIKYKITKDADAKRRAIQAATLLAGRFNLAGNFIRAWNFDKIGWSIIDSCINLSLLFWATEETGDPRFKYIAMAHADTVLKHFIRGDGSVRHIVSFDPESGEFIKALGGQGASPDSAWSRGQAWALYGMANTYRYTGEIRYLRAAQRVAHFYIASLPEDYIPYWDFRLPDFKDEPRDTSAASCAASGLIEIAKSLSAEEGQLYQKWAVKIVNSLAKSYASWDKPEYEGILTGATGNKPQGSHINVSLIYGDYYFVEAVAKLTGWTKNIF